VAEKRQGILVEGWDVQNFCDIECHRISDGQRQNAGASLKIFPEAPIMRQNAVESALVKEFVS
jgi:hypothetical protein